MTILTEHSREQGSRLPRFPVAGGRARRGEDLAERLHHDARWSRTSAGWRSAVIVILLIMSMYSIAIMVERFLTYSRRQEAVARVRAARRAGPEERPHRGGHQHQRQAQEVAPRDGRQRRPSGVPRARAVSRHLRRRDRGLEARSPARHRHQVGRVQARPLGPGDHRLDRPVRRVCSARCSASSTPSPA